MFQSILTNDVSSISIKASIICMVASIILGIVVAFVHMYTEKSSKTFIITLALLPVLVQVVMLMVNGNLGTSVAILGAFSLIRFRSMPGTSRELLSVFFAMAIGLSTGMGHILFAVIFTVLVSVCIIIFSKSKFGETKNEEKSLKIAIPESLNYIDIFEDLFKKYTSKNKLRKIKTTNMGSMYELSYIIELKKDVNVKDFIDDIRCKNGNLTVAITEAESMTAEL